MAPTLAPKPPSRQWDPDKILGIHARPQNQPSTLTYSYRNLMFCVGTAVTRGGARCDWRIKSKKYEEVLALLSEMEKLAPKEVLESREGLLSKLVWLCLCVENHHYQWGMVLERWEERLRMLKEEWEQKERELMRDVLLLRGEVGREKGRVGIERERREELEREFAVLREQLSAEKDKVDVLEEKLQWREVDRQDLLAQIEKLTAQLDAASHARDELTQQLHETNKRLDETSATLAKKSTLLHSEQQSTTTLQQRVRSLTTEIGTLRQTLYSTQHELTDLLHAERQSNTLQQKAQSLTTELTTLRQTLDRTQHELSESRKANKQQGAAAAEEKKRLSERIQILETRSTLSVIVGKMKKAVGHIVGGGWALRKK
jgi:predicted  nucleic acid-binding Zn-ribbon protein